MYAFDFDDLEKSERAESRSAQASKDAASSSRMVRVGGKLAAEGYKTEAPPGTGGYAQRIRHWQQTALALAEMVRRMREEFVEGKGWMEGMRCLVENTPRDHAGRRYGLDDFAGPLLRDHFIQWTATHSRAENFRKVLGRLEMKVVVATKHLDLSHDWTIRPGAWGQETREAARRLGATEMPPFDGFMHMKRGLLFVGLPLRLYLLDSPHLYELLRRMRGLASVAPQAVRAHLDAYGVLVFALLAALQALHAARLTGKRGGCGAMGLDALSATARREGDGFVVQGVKDSALIFRGIWVRSRIDEFEAKYTWSFNSFSRSVDGVLWVLDFYAVEGAAEVAKIAWEESHILLYVARFHAPSSTWAFPVQFFNSGLAADVEKELVVPPFVDYEFETLNGTTFELRSSMSTAMRAAMLSQLERKWRISLAEEAPLLLELLEGQGCKDYSGLNRKLKVSVRFIKEIKPCKPMLDILKAGTGPPEDLLLAFPPKDPEAARDAKSIFGAGLSELNSMMDFGSLRPLGEWIPGQKIGAGL